jgi:hypothetical protein
LLIQLLLGAGSYFGKFTPMLPLPMGGLVFITTLHLITGALMLVTSLVITLWAYRLSNAAPSLAAKIFTEQYSV